MDLDQSELLELARASNERPRADQEIIMSKSALHRIDQFFNGPSGRADNWRDLAEAAKTWASGAGDRAKYEALLNDIAVTEEFHGYLILQVKAGKLPAGG